MRLFHSLALSVCIALAVPAQAQDAETLADIRQELTVLNVEIQKLKRELSTTGAPATNLVGDTVLERVTAIEAELQRITSKTEQLDHRVNRVIADGTNRIGDLEFRLVELEGGDISQLGETSTLGGDEEATAPDEVVPEDSTTGEELAVGERSDFEAAAQALTDGEFAAAAEKFALFNETYPGSPLAAEAALQRGKALDGLGDTREAARAYLAAFSGNASGPQAPQALFELGSALGRLDQQEQACITLSEVGVRFPVSPVVNEAEAERVKLACP
ncbi:tol-pal system protein YbgF [Epibacterium ulvae]|uniref:tol-pal system protein YbgF n=1 Tax=Epibacterium ulvae TaxID=1156985 RepID=UPI001BFC4844|nr:tol-pal system protein YbgF [Epibacterium ulvae]MBT8153020.1 tol-pal system protein YbgF [Epibacterium ulvae]